MRQSQKDPFKLNQIRTIDQLQNKIPNNISMCELLNNFKEIICVQIKRFNESSIQEKMMEMYDIENNDVIIL